MAKKGKVLVVDDGHIDLNTHVWDDQLFSERLIATNQIEPNQALDVSRFMKEAIAELGIHTITTPIIDEMLKVKLMEYGLNQPTPMRLVKDLFVRNGLPLSQNARTVLERRYLRKNDSGQPMESPSEMFRRVARTIASAEIPFGGADDARTMEAAFYDMMTSFRFLPNSPTLMNAGRELGQLAACFVLPVKDSMDGIFDTLKNAAIIHKSGGGTGFSFSRLRPKNSRVGTTGGIASGPVSFMKIFNTATEQVKQGGTRRGANMAILRVDHPDILEFIHCKRNGNELNNFNISVGLTESFMQAVEANAEYDLLDPYLDSVTGRLNASEVYKSLVDQAWATGDPGIIFLDRLNRDNPTPDLGEIESTNPCGEQPLLPMEACNLGSINLALMVTMDTDAPSIDFGLLEETIRLAVRFLDNTIDKSKYPLVEIEAMVKGNRKIGLGVMGFADMLFQLGIPYNSEQALDTAEAVMGFVQRVSHEASIELAETRGVFSNFSQSRFDDVPEARFRNATTTTIAPTGTLSIIANCSSGVEPLFALSFQRTVMDNDKLVEVNPYFEEAAQRGGFYSEELIERIAEHGSIQSMDEIPDEMKSVFVTAHDIDPEWHVRMQAAFQKHTDNAVSKTVNLPREATSTDVQRIYDLAYELGCKGVTIYRDGSKENQVLSVARRETPERDSFMAAVKDRPEILPGFTSKVKTGLGQLYVTVTEYNGRPFEVFATIGKSGRSTTAKTEAIGRLVSLALRSGVNAETVVEQLKGIGGEHPVFQNGGLVLSIPDAIARVLERRYMVDSDGVRVDGKGLAGEKCPECSQTISFEEGCMTCHFCGYTKCG